MNTESKEEELLIKFLASYTHCDHIGDVANDVDRLLREMGINDDWYSQEELAEVLKSHFGDVETLNGIKI